MDGGGTGRSISCGPRAPGSFARTRDRKDYAFQPAEPTLLERLKDGGVPVHAVGKIEAGANLVQIYTGLIYQGPALVTEAASAIRRHHRQAQA